MHLQIVRDAPGSCPICGMALVPVAGTGEVDDSELKDLTRRFWVGAAGWPILKKFWLSVAHWSLNMYTLIGLGVGLAYLYSLVAVLAPGIFPAEFREHDGAVGTYFEAAAVIVTLVILGDLLQLRAMGKTSQAVRDLLKLAPNLAWRVRDDGTEEQVKLDDVKVVLP